MPVDPPNSASSSETPNHQEHIAAIILAAGGSSRFGKSKQLLQLHGKSLVRRIADEALAADCAPIIVVTGGNDAAIRNEFRSSEAEFVMNSDWASGIGTSIHAGMRHLVNTVPDSDAVVLLVCDQPFVNAETIGKLRSLHQQTRRPIIASSYSSTLGVPALFARGLFKELLTLNGDSGAKSLIFSHRDQVTDYPFPEGALDIDTVEQWNELQSASVPRSTSAA